MRAFVALVIGAVVGVTLVFLALAADKPAAPAVKWVPENETPAAATAVVEGLPTKALQELGARIAEGDSPSSLFPVFVVADSAADQANLPPMLGAYRIEGSTLQFQPKYPLEPGVSYRAELRFEKNPAVSSNYVFNKTPPTTPTRVTEVFPTDKELPANLLKFYLYFSAPMRRGGVLDFIELLDESGASVELPFLDLAEELWNPGQTRLTLLIDPGRIKRGLRPNEELGPVLEEGQSYTLIIRREWLDSAKLPLKEDFRKEFTVSQSNRQPPDPERWSFLRPRAETDEELMFTFDHPVDHAVVGRLFSVTSGSGEPVPGTVRFTDGERKICFKPSQPWQQAEYQVHIPHDIEDIVGNQVGRPFEIDLFDKTEPLSTNRKEVYSFEPK